MVATPPSSSDSSDKKMKLENNEINSNPNPELNSSDDPFEDFMKSTSPSVVFLRRLVDSSLTSATMGFALGYGAGLVDKQGFKGSFGVAGSFAKTVAFVTGFYGLVECALKSLRGKDDVFNAGVAGCCVGLTINHPGIPPLHKCLTMGATLFIFKGLVRKHSALAHSSSLTSKRSQSHLAGVLPPLSLPLPNELKESFSSFCESIKKM